MLQQLLMNLGFGQASDLGFLQWLEQGQGGAQIQQAFGSEQWPHQLQESWPDYMDWLDGWYRMYQDESYGGNPPGPDDVMGPGTPGGPDGSEWWNQGKDPSTWTTYPPSETGDQNPRDIQGPDGPLGPSGPLPGGGGGGFGGGGGGGTPGGGPGAMLPTIPASFYEAPDPFQYPDFVPPEWETPAFNAPGPFEYAEFAPPTTVTDPGYQFRRDEGLRAVKNAQSATGFLRGGPAAKQLVDYTESVADQGYQGDFNRGYTTWAGNRSAAAQDYDTLWRNTLAEYMLDYEAERDKFTRGLQTYGTNFGTAATAYGFELDRAAGSAGGRQGAASLAGNLALGQGALDLNADNSRWQNLLQLYDISTRSLPTYTPTYGVQGFGF
jgi:hypothetical protein